MTVERADRLGEEIRNGVADLSAEEGLDTFMVESMSTMLMFRNYRAKHRTLTALTLPE